jgi:hypothetical protein
MKTKLVSVYLMLGVLFFGLSSFNAQPDVLNVSAVQETATLNATYDGKEDYGYNFIFMDTEGNERTFTFQEVEASFLSMFDLYSDTLIKTKFKITYKVTVEKMVDENGNVDEEETNTIIKLEKL